MTKLILIALLMSLSGCVTDQENQAEKYTDMSYKLRNCVQAQLDVMSNSDHVQKWDAELYNAVADRCEKWHGFSSTQTWRDK